MERNDELKWITIETASVENRNNFWKAILLSVVKPHLINRRLAGAEQIYACQSNAPESNANGELIRKFASYIQDHSEDEINKEFVMKILIEIGCQNKFIDKDNQEISKCDLNKEKQILIILNKLLPKNLTSHKCTYEINIIDSLNNQAGFLNLFQNQTTGFLKRFVVQLKDSHNEQYEMSVLAPNEANENFTRQTTWIKHVFKPKVLKWIVSMEDDYEKKQKTAIDSVASLSLINLSEYNQLYNELKVKYGAHMVKIWPENTDPLKFVYEDVAIASYLILLWRAERHKLQIDRLQSFVDLGCGNGLLVYILSSEGHQGYGIDVRKRGIWDLYPSTTILKTLAIVPSDRSLFPDIDWIIGNHSDELSPWIPVISARSSYHSRYFLLPCCSFEFSGKKFQRRSCTVSQYMDFMNYAQEISDVCGFKTQIDRLKIPSTKRICLIGSERNYPADEQHNRETDIQKFINANSENVESKNVEQNWNNDFRPRSDVEKVQNCSKIDRSIQNDIIERVFSELMRKKRYLNDLHHSNWNAGGKVLLVDLVKIIPSDKLMALKSECGGLQTLLKNHSQVFRVIQGTVELKIPLKLVEKKEELKAKGLEIQLKQKPCWFRDNHPDGCPLADDDCSFKH